MKPQVGQKLWSSCAGESYGTIVAVGEDANGTPTIDIVTPISNLVCFEDETEEWPHPVLSFVDSKADVILRDLQYRMSGDYIVCNTPGNDCYRCTKLFSLQ